MKAAAAFSGHGSTTVVIELVAGTQDGTRELMAREADGKPLEREVRGPETYVRRAEPDRCVVDGLLVWHFDLERAPVDA